MQNQLLEPEVLSFVARDSQTGRAATHLLWAKPIKKTCLKVGYVGDWMLWNIMNIINILLKHPQVSMLKPSPNCSQPFGEEFLHHPR